MFNQLFAGGDDPANFESLMSSVMAELGKDLGQEPGLNDDLARLLQGAGAQGGLVIQIVLSVRGVSERGVLPLKNALLLAE